MPWIRVDDKAPRHPKFVAAGPVASWLWLCGLAYASEHGTDGFIPADALGVLGVKRAHRYVPILSRLGIWKPTENGWLIHDFHDYQPSRAQVRERRRQTAERVKNWRKRRNLAHGNEPVTTSHAPGGPSRNAPRNTGSNAVSNAAPDPDPIVLSERDLLVRGAGPSAPSLPAHAQKPLAYRGRIDVAWPGRPPVPGSLHAELRLLLGDADQDAADAKLRAWYPTVAESWAGKPIGDDPFRFWRARFREWVGTTVAPLAGRPQGADPKPPSTPAGPWGDTLEAVVMDIGRHAAGTWIVPLRPAAQMSDTNLVLEAPTADHAAFVSKRYLETLTTRARESWGFPDLVVTITTKESNA